MARRIVAAAALRGADAQELLAATNLTMAQVEDPNGRVAHGTFLALWNEAARLTGDHDFGLHLAELNHRWAGNALYYAVASCATFQHVLESLRRYSRLAHEAMVIQSWETDGYAWIRVGVNDPLGTTRHGVEFAIARLLLHGQTCIGEEFVPGAIHLPHPQPDDISEHLRIFKLKPEFSQPHAQLSFPARLLTQRLSQHDPLVHSHLGQLLDQILTRFDAERDFRARVQKAIAERLQHGVPDIQDVAKQLTMSARTLQRRLQEEGTSFLDVVNLARHRLAEQYLSVPTLSLSEIAFLLGFTEPSNFHRAFKRWTGLTPLEARKRALDGPGVVHG